MTCFESIKAKQLNRILEKFVIKIFVLMKQHHQKVVFHRYYEPLFNWISIITNLISFYANIWVTQTLFQRCLATHIFMLELYLLVFSSQEIKNFIFSQFLNLINLNFLLQTNVVFEEQNRYIHPYSALKLKFEYPQFFIFLNLSLQWNFIAGASFE